MKRRTAPSLSRPAGRTVSPSRVRPVLITGGAGFIGSNLANRLLGAGHRVVILDNLSRRGVERNLAWLQARHGTRVQIEVGDVRDAALVQRLVRSARQVYHFAAQVAVTLSVTDAVGDFDVNARGTLNVLEALRAAPHQPPLLFTSTNKVYGALADLDVRPAGSRYVPSRADVARHGIDESRPLQFHSPYGCSKGAADQYVLDYAATFDLPTVVFRMSCIYGPRQCGSEDQGWVAYFVLKSLVGDTLTIYGDGLQVRDLLFVDDLVDALVLAHETLDQTAGRAFNIGGGPANAVSLLELLDAIAVLHDRPMPTRMAGWRPGDQRYFVSNVARFAAACGWKPRTRVADGIAQLSAWLQTSLQEARPARARRHGAIAEKAS